MSSPSPTHLVGNWVLPETEFDPLERTPKMPITFDTIQITPRELYGANTVFTKDSHMPYDAKQKLLDLILKQDSVLEIYNTLFSTYAGRGVDITEPWYREQKKHATYGRRLYKALKILLDFELKQGGIDLLYQQVQDPRVHPFGGRSRTRQSLPKRNSKSKRS